MKYASKQNQGKGRRSGAVKIQWIKIVPNASDHVGPKQRVYFFGTGIADFYGYFDLTARTISYVNLLATSMESTAITVTCTLSTAPRDIDFQHLDDFYFPGPPPPPVPDIHEAVLYSSTPHELVTRVV